MDVDRSALELRMWRSDLVDRWSLCGTTANFLSRYLAPSDPAGHVARSTVFNEVIENAAKYAAPGSTPIVVRAWRRGDDIVLETHHPAVAEQARRLERWLEEVGQADPGAVLERTAAAEHGASRLGLLMLLRDHDARLSVEVGPRAGDHCDVTVRIELPGAASEATRRG